MGTARRLGLDTAATLARSRQTRDDRTRARVTRRLLSAGLVALPVVVLADLLATRALG